MKTRTIKGIYGNGGLGNNPCTVFTYGQWYTVEGSCNVNMAPTTIYDIIAWTDERFESGLFTLDIERIEDVDGFTWCEEINSLEQLIEAVEA